MVMDDIAFQCGVRAKKSCVGIAFCNVSAPPPTLPCDASAQVSDVDLALGKAVLYSTVANNGCNPNSLTDGIAQSSNSNNYWRSLSGNGDGDWVSVRFESTTCVRRIKMVARNSWTTWSEGIIGQVLVGETWTQCGEAMTDDLGQFGTFTFECALEGTGVRLFKSTNGLAAASELEVYGG